MVCCIDILPVELIRVIFCYLDGVDIVRCFVGISDYMDDILRSYENYSLSLRNISKSSFDLICNNIKPWQVVRLTLSDEISTPGLIRLFFKRFQLEEFTRLRSLYLYSVDLEKLLTDLVCKISKLTELEIFIIDECYALDDGLISLNIHSPLSRFSVSFMNSMPYGANLFNFSSSRVDLLEYINCQLSGHVDLSRLCARMPLLRTLKARLSDFPPATAFSPIVSPKLKRLDLTFNNGLMGVLTRGNLTFNLIKHQLSSLTSQLQHLILSTLNTDVDIADGDAWKEFLSTFEQLHRFDFRFSFAFDGTLDVTSERIEAFKSNYWRNERKWYVTVNPHSVFSVPYFSPHKIELLCSRYPSHYIWTTAPSQHLCYEKTKTVIFDGNSLQKSQREKNIYYKNVEHITRFNFSDKDDPFQPIIDLPLIKTTFNLSRVIVFEGVPAKTSTMFLDYIALLPRLQEIHFHYSPKLFQNVPLLSNIRRVRIWINEQDQTYFNRDLDELCRVFNYVEHLHLMRRIDNQKIYYLIQRLNHLCSIAVLCKPDDEILTNLNQWNAQETILSLSSIYCNVADSELIAFWIDTSQKHLINKFRSHTLPKTSNRKFCILL